MSKNGKRRSFWKRVLTFDLMVILIFLLNISALMVFVVAEIAILTRSYNRHRRFHSNSGGVMT